MKRQPKLPQAHELRDDYAKTRTYHRVSQADRLRDALDPAKAPSKVVRFADMTPAQKAEMRRLYGEKK